MPVVDQDSICCPNLRGHDPRTGNWFAAPSDYIETSGFKGDEATYGREHPGLRLWRYNTGISLHDVFHVVRF